MNYRYLVLTLAINFFVNGSKVFGQYLQNEIPTGPRTGILMGYDKQVMEEINQLPPNKVLEINDGVIRNVYLVDNVLYIEPDFTSHWGFGFVVGEKKKVGFDKKNGMDRGVFTTYPIKVNKGIKENPYFTVHYDLEASKKYMLAQKKLLFDFCFPCYHLMDFIEEDFEDTDDVFERIDILSAYGIGNSVRTFESYFFYKSLPYLVNENSRVYDFGVLFE